MKIFTFGHAPVPVRDVTKVVQSTGLAKTPFRWNRLVTVGGDGSDMVGGSGDGLTKGLATGVGIGIGLLLAGATFAFLKGKKIA